MTLPKQTFYFYNFSISSFLTTVAFVPSKMGKNKGRGMGSMLEAYMSSLEINTNGLSR
jgi:hypothetical protein